VKVYESRLYTKGGNIATIRAHRIHGVWISLSAAALDEWELQGQLEPMAEDSILHEFAHAIQWDRQGRTQKDLNHGPVWRAICREVGCVPLRRHSDGLVLALANKRAKKAKRGLVSTEGRGKTKKIDKVVKKPVIQTKPTGQSRRWYWPESYVPTLREDGFEYVAQPLTSGKELRLPRYLEMKGRGYSLITPKRAVRAYEWAYTSGFIVS
jgi:hypothetical protein